MRLRSFALYIGGLTACLAGCGGDEQAKRADPFVAARQGLTPSAARKAAPRWESVASLNGSGPASRRIQISQRALQWRVRWRCSGDKRISFSTTTAPPGAGSPTGARCPGTGTRRWSELGPVELGVEAEGRWSAAVEQQFDTALREPPLAQMRSPAARELRRGRFARIEGRGTGTARLYRLPSGRLALRLEQITLPPTAGMFVWLSRTRDPTTTKEAIGVSPVRLGPIKSTLGDQNYVLPADLSADVVRSVVIWYEPTQTAYIAAALSR